MKLDDFACATCAIKRRVVVSCSEPVTSAMRTRSASTASSEVLQ